MLRRSKLRKSWSNLIGCRAQPLFRNRGCCSGNSLQHGKFLGEVPCLLQETKSDKEALHI